MNKTTLQHLQKQAAHHQLGEPLACIVGSPQPISRLGLLATSIGLVLIVVLALLAPVLIALLPWWQVVLVLIVVVCWSATGSWLQLGSLLGHKGIEALLCTDSIVWKHRRSVEVVRWQDIESLWRKTTHGSAIRYEIRRRDGQVVTLDSRVPEAEKLARFVEQVIVARHCPSLMQEYQNGAMLKFGPLCISRGGLRVSENPEVLLWDQIKYVRNEKGVLHIQAKHTTTLWATIPLATIPNVCLLGAMMHAIHALHRTQAPMLERSA